MMPGTRILVCFACFIVVINSCLVPDKKGGQEVHIFHIGSPDTRPMDEPDIIKLHIPDARKKRETSEDERNNPIISCQNDEDCPPDLKCSSETSKCHRSKESSSVKSSDTLDSGNLDESYEYAE